MKTIAIMTNEGLMDVRCYGVYGNYGVTKETYGSDYAVTHIPTGLKARGDLTLREARIQARTWNALVPDDLSTPEARQQFVKNKKCLWAVLTGLNEWCEDATERQRIEHMVETLREMVEQHVHFRQGVTL